MATEILSRPLSYVERLAQRNCDDIELVVIHCTELPDMSMARQWGEKEMHADSQTGNSGHFYIDRDGRIESWVPIDRVAHHVRDQNTHTIGIELVNLGRYPDWFSSDHQQMTEAYPAAQIEALIDLINDLGKRLPGLTQLAGHEQLDTNMIQADDKPGVLIQRKLDPGVMFPWQKLLSSVQLTRFSSKKKLKQLRLIL